MATNNRKELKKDMLTFASLMAFVLSLFLVGCQTNGKAVVIKQIKPTGTEVSPELRVKCETPPLDLGASKFQMLGESFMVIESCEKKRARLVNLIDNANAGTEAEVAAAKKKK